MKYLRSDVVFQEIPGEISLAFEITNCPYRCPDCHSSELQTDIGVVLDIPTLEHFIKVNTFDGKTLFSCVLFLGGDHDLGLFELLSYCRAKGLKTALYTGSDDVSDELKGVLNYLKTGKYIKEIGGLKSPKTNQKLQVLC
jgi:anaerobic ribonucleoside-triphosphate reductase activating protein